jgi:hypothetical protein
MSDEQQGSAFERIRDETAEGDEYWSGRELSRVLGYGDWRNFSDGSPRLKAGASRVTPGIVAPMP